MSELEKVNQYLREHGYDPEQVEIRGKVLVEALTENVTLRSEVDELTKQLESVKVYFGFGIFNSQLWDWIINRSKDAHDYTCYTRDLQDSNAALQSALTTAQEENKRYKDALEEIANYDTNPCKTRVWTWAHDFELVKEYAQSALNGGKNG